MPCVFAPYAVADIHRVYAEGGTLQDVWEAPFLRTIRRWQREHGYGQEEPSAAGNWLRPCPIRDHYTLFRRWIERHNPEPEDEAGGQALSQPVWEGEYLRG